MIKEIWINLPVKDVQKSKRFFTDIGFSANANFPDSEQSASVMVGEKNVVVMLFQESVFKGIAQNDPADTKRGTEVLFSFDAESRNEVDEMAAKVKQAGGTVFGGPAESQGWMYGFGFTDPDGHRWNMLHMDFSKMPK